MKIIERIRNLFKKSKKEGIGERHYHELVKKSAFEYLSSSVGDDTELYALNYFGTRITYKDMFIEIDKIAKSLKYLNIEKGEVVSICMPNTVEAIEFFYAINKIGAIADMIHPLCSKVEIESYLIESKSKVLIMYDENSDKIKDILDKTEIFKVVLVSVSESMPRLLKTGYNIQKGIKKKLKFKDERLMTFKDFLRLGILYFADPSEKCIEEDIALILHSGGTSGKPKGILIDNYAFNSLAYQSSVNVEKVEPKDKIVTVLPIFHGFGLGVCLHCPLSLKVEVILMPEFDILRFAKIIKKYRPQVLAGVPTLFEAMMMSKEFDLVDLSCLKYMISGGDSLSINTENKINGFLESHGANIKVTKGYGMSESTAATSYTFEGTNISGSIGIPMIKNAFAICKEDSVEHLPFGSEGEICVCGPSLMIGYLGKREETMKVLKKHKDGKMWLHTGDVGYIDENGILFFTQRLKRIIVSSGFNVYPSQIEEVINGHPHVKKCCVVGVPHPYKMSIPRAFIVLEDGFKPTAKLKAEIRILCKNYLAVYSQPKEFVFLDDLPKTLYNKVDYKKLEKGEY